VRRTGIDLTPTGCHVVDAEFSRRRTGADGAVCRVHHYASLARTDGDLALTDALKTLLHDESFPRRASVNLWQVRSSHQYRHVPAADEPQLRIAAHEYGASVLGMHVADVTVAAAVGATRQDTPFSSKTELSFFAAPTQDIRDLLRPILDAGFSVEAVTTPCGALWAQARLRRSSLPGEPHAYVAVGPTQSALGIFADGLLLYGRDLDWGFATAGADGGRVVDRETISSRLSLELRRSFLYVKQFWEPDVTQVVLCGEMPEIRSLTAPLIERLNVEVETLDTLDGIDSTAVPTDLSDHISSFRLASAIAVEPPPANLLPVPATRFSRMPLRFAAVGTAAAIAIAAFLYGHADVRRSRAEHQIERIGRQVPPIESQHPDGAGASLARALEVIEHAASETVTVSGIRAISARQGWTVAVDAVVLGGDQAGMRQQTEEFSRQLAGTDMFEGPPMLQITPQSTGLDVAVTLEVRR
jgi:hypothetical protein